MLYVLSVKIWKLAGVLERGDQQGTWLVIIFIYFFCAKVNAVDTLWADGVWFSPASVLWKYLIQNKWHLRFILQLLFYMKCFIMVSSMH
jgi:hypothetical protein